MSGPVSHTLVITGYHAAVDLKRLGLATRAVVSVRVGGAFDLELAVATMERFEQVLDRFHRCGQTTAIVVSAPMDRRTIIRAVLPGKGVV